jgi:beta-glucuronidase
MYTTGPTNMWMWEKIVSDFRNYTQELFDNHVKSLAELIRRDKNRPSVILWSVANEPNSGEEGADEYFR